MQRLPQALRKQLGEVQPGDSVLSTPGPTSCGLSTQPQKAAPSLLPRQRRWLRPASPQSGVVTGGMEEGAAGEAGPEAGRGLSQRQTPPLQLQTSLPPILLPPTLPKPLPDSVTSTGSKRTRWASLSPPAPGETRTPGTPQRHRPWPSGSLGGSAVQQVFLSRYWCQLLNCSSPVFISTFRASGAQPVNSSCAGGEMMISLSLTLSPVHSHHSSITGPKSPVPSQ